MKEDKGSELHESSTTVRLKHLDYIQNIVTRMSQSSVQAKSWLLPVVTAAFGYALTQRSVEVALLGISAILLFGYMDVNYLRQERLYRRLYNAVVRQDVKIPELSLDPHDYEETAPDADGEANTQKGQFNSGRCRRSKINVKEWFRVLTSWSIAPFYGALLFVGALVLCHALIR